MSRPDKFPSGVPYELGLAVMQTLQSEAGLAGALILDNPVRATALAEGDRIVFFEEQRDVFVEQPGQTAHRVYHFSLGVISRAEEGARRQAHSDYRLVKRQVRMSLMQRVGAMGLTITGAGLVEGDVHYRLENIDVGGALVLGMFTLSYRDKDLF